MKTLFSQAPKPSLADLGVPPKAFYPVDMTWVKGKSIVAMGTPEILLVSQVHQTVVHSPSIGMDDLLNVNSAPDHGLKGGTAAIRYDFSMLQASPLENSEDNGLCFCTSAAKAFDSFWLAVAFINLNFTETGDFCSKPERLSAESP